VVRRKWIRGWLIVALVALAGGAAVYFDVERRRRREMEGGFHPELSEKTAAGPAELAKRFEDPEEIRRFLELVEEKGRAMNVRYRALQHRRRQRTKLLDDAGKIIADEFIVEIVDFPNNHERKRIIEQKDLRTEKLIEGQSALQREIAARRTPMMLPFVPEARHEDFDYHFAGVELLDRTPVVKIDVAPNPPFNPTLAGTTWGKVEGAFWVDAETGEPVRFAGRWKQPTGFAHRYEMVYQYGPSENGCTQIRNAASDGSGGALFVFRRYVASTEVDDYRPPERE
jgi:hypothetical protein